MKSTHSIDFPQSDSWLDGPLPVSPTVPSGWTGLERIMPSLVRLFCRNRESALEFGVEYGYSTSVLAQLFDEVHGVDWFKGDEHSNWREDYSDITIANLAHRSNITLWKESYQEYLATVADNQRWDLIHVDVVHTFAATYEVGRWAADHSPVILFHDIEAFWPEVKQAVLQIAEETNREVYLYPRCFGLGILF